MILSSLGQRFRRAVETGDPRLGLLVGAAVSLLVATLFVWRDAIPPADRLENVFLDYTFAWRPPIDESDKILLVDMDDNSMRNLPWPLPRDRYGRAILALDRLGARQVVFDVEFKAVVPERGDYDEETGEYLLSDANAGLRFAIGKCGRVSLAYHFDLKDPLPREVRDKFASVIEVFSKNIAAGTAELGLGPEVEGILEMIREHAVVAIVDRFLTDQPELTFADLKKRILPRYNSKVDRQYLNLLQYAYWQARAARLLETKTEVVSIEGVPAAQSVGYALVPPFYPFLERCQGIGTVNSNVDEDGVMRRPWTQILNAGKPHLYLGLGAALHEMAGPDEALDVVLRRKGVEIRVNGKPGGAARRTVTLPLNEEGRVLVNWAGNDRKRRGKKEEYFKHMSFAKALSFYQTFYEDLDANVRNTLAQLTEEQRAPYAQYVILSDRFREALDGHPSLTFQEARETEAKLEEIRRRLMEDVRGYIREIEKGLPTLTSKRAIENSQRDLLKWKTQFEGIASAYEEEKELRRIVEGRICLIGSAGTASGDLHSAPLAPSTPGMDVIANVMNMVLTGQVIRHVPEWINFLYMLGVGLLITLAVTSWSAAMGSIAASLAVIGATLGVYWVLFTGPMLLITGAGPVAEVVLTYAAVMTFKEVVTGRSKKKLQKELEKNTSPELVSILMEHPEMLAKPRKMEGTFFFSDVKSFTSTSEKMAPEVLVPYINRYLDYMTQVLKERHAYLDKYIGDGIMALFGIPVPSPDHARNACFAALENQARLRDLNAEFEKEKLPSIISRIGIHSGEAIAGYVGAANRSDYTVLGDNVNLASRLEGANKEYESRIMISEATHDLVRGEFQVRELDCIRVVGKKNAVRIFELLAVKGEKPPLDEKFLEEYRVAIELFKERRWQESLEGFERALDLKPGDKPTMIHLSRAGGFLMAPPPDDWQGEFELTSK